MQVSGPNCWGQSVSDQEGWRQVFKDPICKAAQPLLSKLSCPMLKIRRLVQCWSQVRRRQAHSVCFFSNRAFYSNKKIWFTCSLNKKEIEDFPCGPVVKTVLTMQGAQVRFLPWNQESTCCNYGSVQLNN